jgi:hypothetical protein
MFDAMKRMTTLTNATGFVVSMRPVDLSENPPTLFSSTTK